MSYVDTNEKLNQAIDTIVKKRMQELSFNITETCTIVDDTEKDSNRYMVDNGSARYIAISPDRQYYKKDVVYVVVPNGDYNAEKLIIGKYSMTDTKDESFHSPWEDFIPETGNLYLYPKEYKDQLESKEKQYTYIIPSETDNGYNTLGLIAGFNEDKLTQEQNPYTTQVPLICRPNEDEPYKAVAQAPEAYTALGVKAQFKASLGEEIHQGNYGIAVMVVGSKQKYITESERPEDLIVLTENLDVSKMYGDPYHCPIFVTQEVVFNIPKEMQRIIRIQAYVFQDGKFYTSEEELKTVRRNDLTDNVITNISNDSFETITHPFGHKRIDTEDPFMSLNGVTDSSPTKNIFIQNIDIRLGFNKQTYTPKEVYLYTEEPQDFSLTDFPQDSEKYKNSMKRTVNLKWTNLQDLSMAPFDREISQALIDRAHNLYPSLIAEDGFCETLGGYVWSYKEELIGVKWYRYNPGEKIIDIDLNESDWKLIDPKHEPILNTQDNINSLEADIQNNSFLRYVFYIDDSKTTERIRVVLLRNVTFREEISESSHKFLAFGEPYRSNIIDFISTFTLPEKHSFSIGDKINHDTFLCYGLNNQIYPEGKERVKELTIQYLSSFLPPGEFTLDFPIKDTMYRFSEETIENILNNFETSLKLIEKKYLDINRIAISLEDDKKINKAQFVRYRCSVARTLSKELKIPYDIFHTWHNRNSNTIFGAYALYPRQTKTDQVYCTGVFGRSNLRDPDFSPMLAWRWHTEDDSKDWQFIGVNNYPTIPMAIEKIQNRYQLVPYNNQLIDIKVFGKDRKGKSIALTPDNVRWEWKGQNGPIKALPSEGFLPDKNGSHPLYPFILKEIEVIKNTKREPSVDYKLESFKLDSGLNPDFIIKEILDNGQEVYFLDDEKLAFKHILSFTIKIFQDNKNEEKEISYTANLPIQMIYVVGTSSAQNDYNQIKNVAESRGIYTVSYDASGNLATETTGFSDYRLLDKELQDIFEDKLEWSVTPIYFTQRDSDGKGLEPDSTTQEPLRFYGGVLDENIVGSSATICLPRVQKNRLQPAKLKLMNSCEMIVTAKLHNHIIFSSPLDMSENNYFDGWVNDWSGELVIDKEHNVIGAQNMIAGTINPDTKKFTGVSIGQLTNPDYDSIFKEAGIYGFSEGESVYGFKNDGTAYLGSSGVGRIEFDGNEGSIESGGFDSGIGSKFDLKGSKLQFRYPLDRSLPKKILKYLDLCNKYFKGIYLRYQDELKYKEQPLSQDFLNRYNNEFILTENDFIATGETEDAKLKKIINNIYFKYNKIIDYLKSIAANEHLSLDDSNMKEQLENFYQHIYKLPLRGFQAIQDKKGTLVDAIPYYAVQILLDYPYIENGHVVNGNSNGLNFQFMSVMANQSRLFSEEELQGDEKRVLGLPLKGIYDEWAKKQGIYANLVYRWKMYEEYKAQYKEYTKVENPKFADVAEYSELRKAANTKETMSRLEELEKCDNIRYLYGDIDDPSSVQYDRNGATYGANVILYEKHKELYRANVIDVVNKMSELIERAFDIGNRTIKTIDSDFSIVYTEYVLIDSLTKEKKEYGIVYNSVVPQSSEDYSVEILKKEYLKGIPKLFALSADEDEDTLFYSTIPNEYTVTLNGAITSDSSSVFQIGPQDDPQFNIDWNGNTTIKGNFEILDDIGNIVMSVKDGKYILNLGSEGFDLQVSGQSLNELIESMQVSIDSTALEIKNISASAGNYVTTSGRFDKDGLTIARDDSHISTNLNANGMKIFNQVYSGEATPNENILLKVNNTGVDADNISVSNMLNLANRAQIKGCNDIFSNYEIGSEGIGIYWLFD